MWLSCWILWLVWFVMVLFWFDGRCFKVIGFGWLFGSVVCMWYVGEGVSGM